MSPPTAELDLYATAAYRDRVRKDDIELRQGTVVFGSCVNDRTARRFTELSTELSQLGDITLDLSRVSAGAFAKGVVSIVCTVDRLRADGCRCKAVPPNDAYFAALFRNSNWLHFLNPETFPASAFASKVQVALQRFQTAEEQQHLVDRVLEVVLAGMELDVDVIHGLEWSVNEITDNVLNHSEAAQGGFLQVNTFADNNKIEFVVADAGRGIRASLSETHNLSSDGEALTTAIIQGVTRGKAFGAGNGLGCFRDRPSVQGRFLPWLGSCCSKHLPRAEIRALAQMARRAPRL
jgi:anti-sigma regulatory factor (Ser/Thr protein kinase)